MGDFRFRYLKDTSGIWARGFHGSYDGQGINSKYNGFHWAMTTRPMTRVYMASLRNVIFPVRSTAMVPLKIMACPLEFTAHGLATAVYIPMWWLNGDGMIRS